MKPRRFASGGPGEDFPQLVMDARVSRHRRPDVDTDGRRVNQLYLPDALRLYSADMLRQFLYKEEYL